MEAYSVLVASMWVAFIVTPALIWYIARPRGWRL